MKITIDTKEDSHDELCKVASMIHALIKERNKSSGAIINNNNSNNRNNEYVDLFNQPEQEFSLLNSNQSALVHSYPQQPEFSIFDNPPPGPQPITPPAQGGVAPGLFNLFSDDTPTQSAPAEQVQQDMPTFDFDTPVQSLDMTTKQSSDNNDDEPSPVRLKTY